jgi:hypothetical protein
MSHFSVLILGDDPEGQLDPYWELDLPADELPEDYRAEFTTLVATGAFETKAREIIAGIEASRPELAASYQKLLADGRIEAILEDWHGGQKNADGDWGYYRNPQDKWDWFVLGGRFSGLLHLLPGRAGVSGENRRTPDGGAAAPGRCDQARFGDIKWAQTRTAFTPFAVLKDGEWYEQGQMGWWAIVSNAKADAAWEEEVDALLADLLPETLVSVYDCHI